MRSNLTSDCSLRIGVNIDLQSYMDRTVQELPNLLKDHLIRVRRPIINNRTGPRKSSAKPKWQMSHYVRKGNNRSLARRLKQSSAIPDGIIDGKILFGQFDGSSLRTRSSHRQGLPHAEPLTSPTTRLNRRALKASHVLHRAQLSKYTSMTQTLFNILQTNTTTNCDEGAISQKL